MAATGLIAPELKGRGRALTPPEILGEIQRYEARISGILSRFRDYNIAEPDADVYSQLIIEIADLLTDVLGPNQYSKNILVHYNWGVRNQTGSPSQRSVTEILAVIRAAHTRLTRSPELMSPNNRALAEFRASRTHPARSQKIMQAEEHTRQRDHVFVIHGRDEAKWRELRGIIKDTFGLKPIILNEKPDAGCTTVIEKFEHYAKMCNYAIALFTPDDEVSFNSERYLQRLIPLSQGAPYDV
jgi:hypothetical protein